MTFVILWGGGVSGDKMSYLKKNYNMGKNLSFFDPLKIGFWCKFVPQEREFFLTPNFMKYVKKIQICSSPLKNRGRVQTLDDKCLIFLTLPLTLVQACFRQLCFSNGLESAGADRVG